MTGVAGVDEAGRGPLAGPVVAAAVVLDPANPIAGLNDSKQLTARRREALAAEIRNRALAFAVAEASETEIDRLNILRATMLAMQRAVDGLGVPPAEVLIDGNRVPDLGAVAARAVVGGDAIEPAISAASILAKVRRDGLMAELHRRYPEYGFDRHKGYGTAMHRAVLARLGPTPVHRRSFLPVEQMPLFGA